MTGLRITHVQFTSAHAEARGRGLMGFLKCVVGGQLRLDGITLRRTRSGEYALSFPERRDAGGRRHALMRPVDTAARKAIEAAILGELGLTGLDGQEEAP